ncbi:MAG TPA: hypothetical protein PK876_00715 [Elusimicrobiota bacterium]|nr:hypothetical protein [Elusimicrobiota bacterium]
MSPGKRLRSAALSLLIHGALLLPLRLREVLIILVSVLCNPLYKSLRIVGHKVQNTVNSVLIFFAYFIGVGVSCLLSRLMKEDPLGMRSKDTGTFWRKKETSSETVNDLERQY